MAILELEICISHYFTLILYCYFAKVNMKDEGKIIDYIQNSFGWSVKFKSFDAYKGKLPYSLSGAADYALIECEDFRGVAILPKLEDDFRMIRNIVSNIERITGLKAVLILEGIDSYQRRSLIESRISFIIPDKQIYLPDIGALMTERGLGLKQLSADRLSMVATAILLVHLSGKSLKGKSVTDIADIMGYSVKTLSLAVKELEQQGLITILQEGRKKLLDFRLSSKELWEKVVEIGENPVEKRLFTSDIDLATEIGVVASDSALSEISMLSSPVQPIFAVYNRNPRIKELNLNLHDGSAIIEVWKSDPALSSKNGLTDVFSLALTYKDDDDPRIKKELDKIIAETL